ncbi:MAG: hypothetical protein WKH64_15935 [Chloroflexia bacterium]
MASARSAAMLEQRAGRAGGERPPPSALRALDACSTPCDSATAALALFEEVTGEIIHPAGVQSSPAQRVRRRP